jgi:tetratricopeptide (TPR) repeat protein
MYGVWNSNPDANRNKARIELIQFLLKKNAAANAESELMALAASLPSDATSHLEAAQLFAAAHDYPSALAQDEEVLRLDPANANALAGAGEAAYRAGNYATAERYLRAAVAVNSQNPDLRQLLESTQIVLRASPFRTHLSDAERNRRIIAAFAQAEDRLTKCAQQTGVDLNSTASASPLSRLQARWIAAKPDLEHLRSPGETDLPDALMDIVFQIEQQTVTPCGQPQGLDLALLLISRERAAAGQ